MPKRAQCSALSAAAQYWAHHQWGLPLCRQLLQLAQSILKGGDKPGSTQQSTQQALQHSNELHCLVGILVSKLCIAAQQDIWLLTNIAFTEWERLDPLSEPDDEDAELDT